MSFRGEIDEQAAHEERKERLSKVMTSFAQNPTDENRRTMNTVLNNIRIEQGLEPLDFDDLWSEDV